MINAKRIIIIIGAVILLSNCQGALDLPSEEEKYFTLTYRLEGLLDENYEVKDTTILGVELRTATYYPEIDKTRLYFKTFQKRDYPGGFYIRIDSVYIGCKYQMAVLFCKKQPTDYNPDRTNWWVYVTRQDTIITFSDSVFTFKWPEDTLSVVEKYWLLPY